VIDFLFFKGVVPLLDYGLEFRADDSCVGGCLRLRIEPVRMQDVNVEGRKTPSRIGLDERVGVDAHLDDEINQRPVLFATDAGKAVQIKCPGC